MRDGTKPNRKPVWRWILIFEPIVGTTIIASGLKSMNNARMMDAQRGGNPGSAKGLPGS